MPKIQVDAEWLAEVARGILLSEGEVDRGEEVMDIAEKLEEHGLKEVADELRRGAHELMGEEEDA